MGIRRTTEQGSSCQAAGLSSWARFPVGDGLDRPIQGLFHGVEPSLAERLLENAFLFWLEFDGHCRYLTPTLTGRQFDDPTAGWNSHSVVLLSDLPALRRQ